MSQDSKKPEPAGAEPQWKKLVLESLESLKGQMAGISSVLAQLEAQLAKIENDAPCRDLKTMDRGVLVFPTEEEGRKARQLAQNYMTSGDCAQLREKDGYHLAFSGMGEGVFEAIVTNLRRNHFEFSISDSI